MITFNIEGEIFKLSREEGSIRVISGDINALLENQNISTVSELIKHNLKTIKDYYLARTSNIQVSSLDILQVSIKIMINHLYIYNSWRNKYERQINRDLKFNEKDFDDSQTYDVVLYYFKSKYPTDWEEICSALLNMDIYRLREYYKGREQYYNK